MEKTLVEICGSCFLPLKMILVTGRNSGGGHGVVNGIRSESGTYIYRPFYTRKIKLYINNQCHRHKLATQGMIQGLMKMFVLQVGETSISLGRQNVKGIYYGLYSHTTAYYNKKCFHLKPQMMTMGYQRSGTKAYRPGCWPVGFLRCPRY